MDTKIPFTSYDFWAYLSAGFLLLFAADYVAGSKLLMRDTWSIVQGVVAFSSAYAIGHLVASLSSYLLERILVGRLLGAPKDVLFETSKPPKFIRFLLSSYYEPLPLETQNVVNEKAARMGVGKSSEARFQVAFASMKTSPAVLNRLETFLNMYGFCRNVALVGFLDAALLFWSWRWGHGPDEALTGAYLALALGVGMTLRYLKFFRHYAREVLNSFAYAKESEKAT
jgi:hypothetical protein